MNSNHLVISRYVFYILIIADICHGSHDSQAIARTIEHFRQSIITRMTITVFFKFGLYEAVPCVAHRSRNNLGNRADYLLQAAG